MAAKALRERGGTETAPASSSSSRARGLGKPPGDFPGGVNTFLGRETVLKEISEWYVCSRLVTLTGPPGIGKTRLALEFAEGREESRAKRTNVVELAPVSRPAGVSRALAAALSVDEQPGQRLTDTLITRIGRRRLLVVLDNCEHLLTACSKLVDALLSGCPHLLVLATSREPLGLDGEHVWEVGPLAVPDPAVPLEQLGTYPAVALFVEHAIRVQPGFALNAYVAPAVGEICRRLDGVPLALELAAAQLESFIPAEIARHLNDRFGLTTGSHSISPRHRTLEAALDWSHDLLSAAERVLLRRLSVFPGSFDADAVAAICVDEQIVPPAQRGSRDLLDPLARLVSKSLVMATTSPSLETRYRLLETIRAYAGARLGEAHELGRLRQTHARHYLARAERAERELTGPDQGRWFGRLEAEQANLRSALEWSVSHGERELGLRSAGALVLFWRVRCHFSEGRELLEAALSAGEGTSPALRAKALWGVGLMALMAGDIDGAVPVLEESVALCDETDDLQVRGRALLSLGDCGGYRDDPETLLLLEQSAECARKIGDRWCLAHALGVAGFEQEYRGELTAARSLFEECLAVARGAADPQSLRYGLMGLGVVFLRQGDYRSAEPLLEEALAVTTNLGEDYGQATVLVYLGRLAFYRCEYARARELLEAALALMPELGPPETHFGPVLYLAQVALAEGDLPDARVHLDTLHALVPPGAETPVAALRGMAELAAAEGDMLATRSLLERALASARAESEGSEDTAGTLYALGDLARVEGDIERAVRLHHEALELRCQIGDVRAVVTSLEAVAGLGPPADSPEGSARLIGAAQALRDKNDYVRSPAESSRREAVVAQLRTRLGAEKFAAAFTEGAALSIDEAVAETCARRGRRERPSTGWGSLTNREQQVAELVGEGLTNPEIAERLSIARETVKRHVSNVFSKLGVARRGELAMRVWDRNGDAG